MKLELYADETAIREYVAHLREHGRETDQWIATQLESQLPAAPVDVPYLMQNGEVIPLGPDAVVVWVPNNVPNPTASEMQGLIDTPESGVSVSNVMDLLLSED